MWQPEMRDALKKIYGHHDKPPRYWIVAISMMQACDAISHPDIMLIVSSALLYRRKSIKGALQTKN